MAQMLDAEFIGCGGLLSVRASQEGSDWQRRRLAEMSGLVGVRHCMGMCAAFSSYSCAVVG
jgi:hypothetical protein